MSADINAPARERCEHDYADELAPRRLAVARPDGGPAEQARQATLLRLPIRAHADHLHGDGGVA